jgi:outer membrane protein assembly factor BamA
VPFEHTPCAGTCRTRLALVSRLHCILGLGATALVGGCASIPRGRAAVNSVEVEGARALSDSDVTGKIATTPSPKFLGLFRGVVYDYEIFNQSVLQTDLQRIERYYRARGYYRARVRAGRIFYVDNRHVRVQIEVEEGPPVLVREIVIRGAAKLPDDVKLRARRAASALLRIDRPFDEDAFIKAEADVKRALTDSGYAHATVTRVSEVDLPNNRASVAYDVKHHAPARFGEIRIEGLKDLPEAPVRRALDIKPGDTYSTTAIEDAQQALLELGVFSSVQIEPVLDGGPGVERVPLRVQVQPARLRSVQLGGGIQADAIRSDVHLLAGWEHRNFFGGLRRFSVQFRPGVVLYPTRVPDFQAPTDFLPEEKLRAELRQPGFIEARTGAFVRSEFNIYPLLLSPDILENAPILGYREVRGAVGVDRTFGRFYASLLHNVQSNTPFAYKGELYRHLGPVLVSYPELLSTLDFRDDRLEPHKGMFLSNDLQVAGLGGNARDVKIQPDVRGYVPLGKRLTLALRGSVGLLFPQNYGDSLPDNAEGRIPGISDGDWTRDVQLTFLRGFFAGGPSSNRGYVVRGIGPHGVIPFFSPSLARAQLAENCNPLREDVDRGACKLPLGGLSLWEASVELRFPISGPLSGATFCDSADVSPKQVDFRLNRPHLSCGFGLRYGTPVGPIRVDVGYRIPGLQKPKNDIQEREPDTLFFDLPAALAFGIGEAF